MKLTQLFNETLDLSISFDQWKEDLKNSIKENIDETGTGNITVKNWYDSSWEKSFSFTKGYHNIFDDYILKDGKTPSKTDWKIYKKNDKLKGNFDWIADFIQDYIKSQYMKNNDLLKYLKPLFDAGWKIEPYSDEDVIFTKDGMLGIHLKQVLKELKEED